MQRAVITDLNGVKMETSSGHTLTCQPHFPPVDPMSAAVPSLTTSLLLFFQLLLYFHFSNPHPPLPAAHTHTHFVHCQQR